MREVTATEMKNRFGEFLDIARDEAIGICKCGKLSVVMISADEYGRFQKLDDAYWIARARAAEADGDWLSHDDATRLLAQRLTSPE